MGEESKRQDFNTVSKIRLTFEPKGEAAALKKQIRDGLLSFKALEYNHLLAKLSTSNKDFFDVENVLFYNVGNSAFAHLDLDEISFQLEQDNDIENDIYKYEYSLSEEKSSVLNGEPCLSFCFEMDKLTSSLKPLDYWFAVKNGVINQVSKRQIEKFYIVLLIECPQKHGNLASVMKSMLDGVISAFHYETNPSWEVIEHIVKQKHIRESDVIKLLEEREYSLLGGRHLVSPYRNGIKWNPRDENCVGANIRQIICPIDNIKIIGKLIG